MSEIRLRYCKDALGYHRRKTRVVEVGDVGVGGDNPIRIQSMTIADTMNTRATVDEVVRLVDVGCEIVRITAPSLREAENLKQIKAALNRRGVNVPLVADIHYTPNAALVAADYVEKVRINPGNYADKKKFAQREYTDEEYEQELVRIEEKFTPLVLKCQRLGRAMRIGTNHGSLSDRIMNRYGDTAEGMVESALEFVRICEKYDFGDLILSMKSSNPQVAIQAYRLLAARMNELEMDYPFHLGVTEAGDGEEGRVKSAVGIGALLEDGIGDTIRVSLTEDPEAEVPVAFEIARKYNEFSKFSVATGKHVKSSLDAPPKSSLSFLPSVQESPSSMQKGRETPAFAGVTSEVASAKLPHPFEYTRRETLSCNMLYHQLGSGQLPRVETSLLEPLSDADACVRRVSELLGQPGNGKLPVIDEKTLGDQLKCETLQVVAHTREDLHRLRDLKERLLSRSLSIPFAVDVTKIYKRTREAAGVADRLVFELQNEAMAGRIPSVIRAAQYFGRPIEWKISTSRPAGRSTPNGITIDTALERVLESCRKADYWNLLFSLSAVSSIVRPYRYLAGRLDALGGTFPILLRYRSEANFETVMLDASSQLGSLLCDGIGDTILIDADLPPRELLRLSYNILQATRLRISKTEFISCPSCGRTLFDLQSTTERIKSKTSHLKGVKIAIMGCIVNGPGEMADADFGYVGAGQQKVNLFVGKECVQRNISEEIADEQLVDLIKAHGKWVEP